MSKPLPTWLPLSLLLLLSLSFWLLFFNRGLTVHDEGYILDAAWRFARGEIIYKNFFIQYTPGLVVLLGSLFKLIGPSILLGRWLMIAVGLLISLLLYRITHSLIPSFLFLVWGPPQLNFPWPTWFALLFMLASLSSKSKFWSGCFAALTFLFKPNFGIAVIIAHILTGTSWLGLLAPFLVAVIYFLSHQALDSALDTIFVFNLRYAREGIMSTRFPEPNLTSLPQLGKTFFYYFPFALLILSLIKKVPYKIWLFCSLFFLAGLRPTTDILHLSLIYPALFPLIPPLGRKYVWILLIPLFGLGLGKLYLKPYAGFEAPYLKQVHKLDNLLVDDRALVLPQLIKAINAHTSAQEPIFVYPYAPMIYFLSGHPNATRFPIATVDYLASDQSQELINQLAYVNLVVLQHSLKPGKPQIVYDYLANNFKPATTIGDYQLLLRQ